MKKLNEIAETDLEKQAIEKLIKDMRAYTSDSLKVLEIFKNEHLKRPREDGLQEKTIGLNLQKKLNANLYELFQRMHRIVDYPSFVILEDELKKIYGKK